MAESDAPDPRPSGRLKSLLCSFDLEFSPAMASRGLMGISWPHEFGGATLEARSPLVRRRGTVACGHPIRSASNRRPIDWASSLGSCPNPGSQSGVAACRRSVSCAQAVPDDAQQFGRDVVGLTRGRASEAVVERDEPGHSAHREHGEIGVEVAMGPFGKVGVDHLTQPRQGGLKSLAVEGCAPFGISQDDEQ